MRLRDEHMDDVLLLTYMYINTHTYISTIDFLVWVIYVGLASARPNKCMYLLELEAPNNKNTMYMYVYV